jgi:hypothetical protein
MKNGQLWYNTITRRVERVIATGPRVCATSFHREDLVGWGIRRALFLSRFDDQPNSYMRKCTSEEIEGYLREVNESSVVYKEDCLAHG